MSNTAPSVWAKQPGMAEVSMGDSDTTATCFSHPNTSDAPSVYHRQALACYPMGQSQGEIGLDFYYVLGNGPIPNGSLKEDPDHEINNIPSGYTLDTTEKMFIWVR
jgi:hypothetical protein